MKPVEPKRDWTKVHAAIAEVEAHEASYEQTQDVALSLPNAEGSAMLVAWLDRGDELRYEVTRRFFEATRDINGLQPKVKDVYHFARRMSDYDGTKGLTK